jgi:cell division protein FtsL
MKVIVSLFLIVILIVFSVEVYFLLKEKNQLQNKLNELNSRLDLLQAENNQLRSDLDYFSYPENLEKELRSRFNYKKPQEKMIIITP